MIIEKDDQFIEALRMQREVREDLWKAKNKPLRDRLTEEYRNVSKALADYIKSLKK